MRRSVSMPYLLRIVALLLSAALFFNSAGHTLAYIVTRTPSLINTFLSGLEPAGTLTIRKTVTHPFGDGYAIPGDIRFDFTVTLEGYAGKIVRTSQGDLTADENGTVRLTLAPGEAVQLLELREGTNVTVTEAPRPGFTPAEGEIQTVTIGEEEQELVYTNDYAPGPVAQPNLEVNGRKFLEGRDWQEGDRFTFRLEYRSPTGTDWTELGTAAVEYRLVEVPDPNDPEKTILQPQPDFDSFSFTELVQGLTYGQPGTYCFRISEVEGTVPGVTYDKAVSYFDVLVGDADMDGLLEIQSVAGYQHATASYNEQTNTHRIDVTVCNTYAPEGTATVTLRIRKTVESHSGEEKSPAGFTFTLYTPEGEPVATTEQTSAAGETALELTFDAQDVGKTYHFLLKEDGAGQTRRGMTFDDREHPISVSIVDNLDGTISAYIYSTDDYAQEEVAEETEPEETTEPTQETTEPTEETTAPTEESTAPTEEPTAPTEETMVPTEETTAPTEETTMPTEETTVPTEETTVPTEETVIPTEETTVPTEETPAPTEVPTEALPAAETVTVQLVLSDGHALRLRSGGSITILSQDTQPTTLPGAEEVAPIAETDPTEPVPTETAPVDTEPQPEETEPEKEKTLVTVIPEDATDVYTVRFENIYDPADTQAHFGGTKKLSGRALEAGEFRFDLYATGDSFAVTEDMKPIQSVSHDGQGQFSFAPISYGKVGTYHYVVVENGANALGGVTYDPRSFHVVVTVTDDNGTLKARVTTTDALGAEADMVFRNAYQAVQTSAVFSGKKTLTGGTLRADQFLFLLYPADETFTAQGGVLDTAANDRQGRFSFAQIPYTQAGTYYYVIAEDASAEEAGITYDSARYGVRVDVTDDGEGSLVASVSYWLKGTQVEEVHFRNRYTKPDPTTEPTETETSEATTAPTETETEPTQTAKPTETTKPKDPSSPQTGDDSRIRAHVVTMFVSLAAVILLLPDILRQHKRRKR